MSVLLDPYLLSSDKIKQPPATFKESFKFLGPTFILSFFSVSSGELIATTTLIAEAGFIIFWLIIFSCCVKVVARPEFVKHTIQTGEIAMLAFNKLPGTAYGKAMWTVWTVLVVIIVKPLQVAGIAGGMAIILNINIP
ncbi:hypothetical protein [uncultured Eudoraea sp.]|uniref:hypothetical protein n=1 Tax=uncultured Eudoraea sp. TaxID=1035614 RepID=UPI0026077462|nr:hypothetical protein [uncultured Eudoraea sp.]